MMEHEFVTCEWIPCGVTTMVALEDSTLGDRFLDCIIIEGDHDE